MNALAALAAAAVAALGGAGSTATFSDPAGDGGAGPDLTSLTLVDTPGGTLQAAYRVTGMGPSTGIYLTLDTDRDARTGSFSGSEYVAQLKVDASGRRSFDVARWDGRRWAVQPDSASTGLTVAGDLWTVRFGRADIGGATSFRFDVRAELDTTGGRVLAYDFLPDAGRLVYEPAEIGSPTLAPATPRAGRRLTIAFAVPAGTTAIAAEPRLGGRTLPHAESFAAGRATVALTLPKTAKGKLLQVTLTVHVGAASAETTAAFPVR